MMWSRIFLSHLLLLPFVIGVSSRLHYLVVIPAEIHSGTSENICALLTDLNETTTLTITLQHKENITLIKKVVSEPDWQQCISFQVPLVIQRSGEIATVKMKVEGEAFEFTKEKKVLIRALESATFVQTDKPIYKPGQKVKFRVVSLDQNFIPQQLKYPLIEVLDPQRNRIMQWQNVEPQQGIVDLAFELTAEPMMGLYSIGVKRPEQSDISSTFSVEEYVLPKFETTVKLPNLITILEKEFRVAACGRYTYGKPVDGVADVSICRKKGFYWYYSSLSVEDICVKYSGKTDKDGCFSLMVNTDEFNMTSRRHRMSFDVAASISEDGTGIVLNGTGSLQISQEIATVSFEEVEDQYRAGIHYTGKIIASHVDGSPMPNTVVYLTSEYSTVVNETLTTDENGKISFSLDTSSWSGSISLKASLKKERTPWSYEIVTPSYRDAYKHVQPMVSLSKSYLYIQPTRGKLNCNTDVKVNVNFKLLQEELSSDTKKIIFYHMVMARGENVLNGQTEIQLTEPGPSISGIFQISLHVNADVAPLTRVLVYTVLPAGYVLAHSTDLEVSKCFKNKVKMHFSEPEALPGSDSRLYLEASPGSLCAIRAVDQSVLLMKPEEQLSADKVYNLLQVTDTGGYPYQVEEYEGSCSFYRGISRRSIMPPWLDNQNDIFSVFRGAGLKVLTDIKIKKPAECLVYALSRYGLSGSRMDSLPDRRGPGGPMLGAAPDGAVMKDMVSSAPPHNEEKAREYFPETLLWDVISVSSSGAAEYPFTVPDTITEWKAGMFCIADVGFGLSHTISLKTFKPFFLEPTLPYSVIRGEAFSLKVTVFNYLPQPIMIQIDLLESSDFLAAPCDKCEYASCIAADQGKTFVWNVTPKSLGEVNFTVRAEAIKSDQLCGNEEPVVPEKGRTDTVIKPLLVEPEGTQVEMAKSSLVCTDEKPVRESILLQLPPGVVEGSARAHISVIGDIMGTAMQNLDKLLAMPYGCGEQNMVNFVPNIFIMDYLKNTNQVTDEIKEKAIHFLQSGYQRELTYKHSDGSYSAFGERDPGGNTWLTAFVLKSFYKAKSYIFIDDQHITDGLKWLSEHQNPDGCFQNVGKLFSSSMKGGVDDDVSLSAYITAALLELELPQNDEMLKKGLQCLEDQIENITNPYTLALLAYTFTLARHESIRDELLKKLDELAIRKDDTVHWERPKKPEEKECQYCWYRAASAEVEMSCYVLLAILYKANVSGEDIGNAVPIVKWIISQQGPYGGFSSTQDTVVALHALSKYAGLTYSEKGDMSVSLSTNEKVVKEFHITNDNRLLLQQTTLKDIPGTYSAEVTGKGCLFFQTVIKYNIPPPKETAAFSIEAHTIPTECTEESRITFDLEITVSYIGKNSISNMAIIEVKMLSGFIPVKKSIKNLSHPLLKKTEVKTNVVTIYLEEVTKDPIRLRFSVEQDILVQHLKPAVIQIYDYYEQAEEALTEYNAPCSAELKEDNTR
ncbi:alpha-2-macroglobulin-like isoform X2 [Protopterus annectens]|uniref:alpha-2-macroglobulin-like isoform X2 n=1 Tax=Protopterus annectens TaxID=7888 RepID=UPI001CFC1748|nr:alpha-2-macroglobulin-like isoform X2 [Protopterus annectens]